MRFSVLTAAGWWLLLLLMGGCSSSTDGGDNSPPVVIEPGTNGNDRILIVDRDGKSWDVTHAVERYGFEASGFQFGAGAHSLPPIQNPEFFEPEEPGYPSPSNTNLMIGYERNGEARAYPVSIMKDFEVADDVFDGRPIAVGF